MRHQDASEDASVVARVDASVAARVVASVVTRVDASEAASVVARAVASEAASVVVVAASVGEAPSRARPHRGRRRSGEGGCIVDHSTLVVEDGRAASGPPANPIIPENRFVPGKEAWYHA